MPITIAHPAILLPLCRTPLPFSALAIGAMVPDVPLFVDRSEYGATHSLTGILTVDLLGGLAVWFVWARWASVALADLSPTWVRDRLRTPRPPTARSALLAIPAVLIGSASHVAWDAFTHPGEWGVRNISWLGTQHGIFAGYAWAQYVSGVLGMAVLFLAILAALRRVPVQDTGPRVLPEATAPITFALCVVASVVTFAIQLSDGLGPAAFRAAIVGLGSVVVAAAALTVVWHARRRRR